MTDGPSGHDDACEYAQDLHAGRAAQNTDIKTHTVFPTHATSSPFSTAAFHLGVNSVFTRFLESSRRLLILCLLSDKELRLIGLLFDTLSAGNRKTLDERCAPAQWDNEVHTER